MTKWVKTQTPDLCWMSDDLYELFSKGDRGIVSLVNGKFILDYSKLQTWVAESQELGINSIGFLLQAPWQSKTLEEVFCPYLYLKDKKKFTIRQINPEWKIALDTVIQKVLEVAPKNFIVRLMLFDFCQTHWSAPNPFYNKNTGESNNIEKYKHFYDIPLYREIEEKKIVNGKEIKTKIKVKENSIFIDAVMEIVSKYPGKIQISIGNELSTKSNKVIKYSLPAGSLYPNNKPAVLAETIWVWDIANYLVDEWKVDKEDMGWGCMPGNVIEAIKPETNKKEFVPENPMKAMQTLINRIAERVSLSWNKVHREFHGACGGYDEGKMSWWATIVAKWVGNSNSGRGHISTDGDNAFRPTENRKYASLTDKMFAENGATYVRFNYETTFNVFSFIIKKCAFRKKDKNKIWLSVLPQVWKLGVGMKGHCENAKALVDAYEKETGKKATNKGIIWKPTITPNDPIVITDPVVEPIPLNKCGVNKWYKHFSNLNFKGAFEHLFGKHNN